MMVKRPYNRPRKKSKAVFWIIAVIMVIALFYLGSQRFSLDDFEPVSSGATILSIDQAPIVTGSGESTEWIITLVANQAGEKVVGTITPADLEKYNLESLPASSFKIEVSLDDVSCNYDLEAKGNKYIGRLYDAWITEQCQAFACPYEYIDVDDLIAKCNLSGAENCERMVDLNMIEGAGTHTEWCSWFPEESNIDMPGECNLLPEFGGHRLICDDGPPYNIGGGSYELWQIQNNPSLCNACYNNACYSLYPELEVSGFPMCCWTETISTDLRKDDGDWRVEHIGFLPEYNILDVGTTPIAKYNSTITVTLEDGTRIVRSVTEKTKSIDLGEFGMVTWAGNLVGTQFCPQPGIDTGVLQDIDTRDIKLVMKGPGTLYNSYLDNLLELSRIDVDRYTFSMVSLATGQISVIDPGIGGGPIFTRFTLLNNEFEELDEIASLPGRCEAQESNVLSCSTVTPVVFPLLRLTVKASSVGIYISEGMPEIVGISQDRYNFDPDAETVSFALDSNELTPLYIAVKNIGNERDSFDVSLSCPFPVTQQSQRISVGEGATEFAEILASGEGLIQECTVIANSVGFPANRDEYEFRMLVYPNCDQLGIKSANLVYTEEGCFATHTFPSEPCPSGSFWSTNVARCVSFTDVDSKSERELFLSGLAKVDCNTQCNGNKECVRSCLELGNVKPICTGIGQMMSFNDYLCDLSSGSTNQPTYIPEPLPNKVWIDAPICDYLCEFGSTGSDCAEIQTNIKFDYSRDVTTSSIETNGDCPSCFDGIQNQDEEGVDCGGLCEERYGRDYDCGKLDPPLHCYNHVQDGDEEGRDCGGSCLFECDQLIQYPSKLDTGFRIPFWAWVLIGLGSFGIVYLIFFRRRRRKRR